MRRQEIDGCGPERALRGTDRGVSRIGTEELMVAGGAVQILWPCEGKELFVKSIAALWQQLADFRRATRSFTPK